MSRLTPDDGYADGIVSRASQAPLANSKKSVHALADVSIIETSTTFSGASCRSSRGEPVCRCAPAAMAPAARKRAAVQPRFKLWKAFRNMTDLWTECPANVEAGKAL